MDASHAVLLLGLALVLGGAIVFVRFSRKKSAAPASLSAGPRPSPPSAGGPPSSAAPASVAAPSKPSSTPTPTAPVSLLPGQSPRLIAPVSASLPVLNQGLAYGEDDEEEGPTKLASLDDVQTTDPARLVVHSPGADQDDGASLPALLLVMAVARTDTGQRRTNNEDSHAVHEDLGLFVIADGMGGHQGGEIASRLATEVTGRCYREQSFPGEPAPGLSPQADRLQRAVVAANGAIFAQAEKDKALIGMGTTIVAAQFSPNKRRLSIAHVGDSRCYRLRDGVFKQLTTDHTLGTLIGAKGSNGELLTRALGQRARVEVDLQIDETQPGDTYLLCTDGLSKMVTDDDIKALLLSPASAAEVAQSLVNAANDRGGKDNITVIVVRTNPL